MNFNQLYLIYGVEYAKYTASREQVDTSMMLDATDTFLSYAIHDGRMSDGLLTDFELYYTSKGLVQVSNDVRRRILHELESRNLSLTDLSKITGKAQSTLSVHLDKMVDEDLIAVHEDPDDSRRKVYSLVSVMLAYSKPPSDEAMTIAMKVLSEVADDPVATRNALARFVFLGFDGMGLSVEPMATILGSIHAMALGGSLTGASVEDTVASARDYYKRMGFGDASVYSLNPLSITIQDGMSFTADCAKSLGNYAIGFFSKVLEDATGKTYVVTSSEVFGMDGNYFRFTLEPLSQRSLRGFERKEGAVPEDLARPQVHAYAPLGDPSVPVAGRRRIPAADHETSDEHGVPVDETCPEEGRYGLPSAFDEHVLDAHVGELPEDRLQVYAVRPGADGLLAVPFAVASLEGHHYRGGPLVQHHGVVGRPSVRVQNDPDGVGVVVQVLEREVRVIGDDGPHADQYGVVLATQTLGARLVLVRGDGDLAPVDAGDLAVGRHGAVDVDERSHLAPPGVTVKRYTSLVLSTPNFTSRKDSRVSI